MFAASGDIPEHWRRRDLLPTNEPSGARMESWQERAPATVIDRDHDAQVPVRLVIPESLSLNLESRTAHADSLDRLLIVEQTLDQLKVGRLPKLRYLALRDRQRLRSIHGYEAYASPLVSHSRTLAQQRSVYFGRRELSLGRGRKG